MSELKNNERTNSAAYFVNPVKLTVCICTFAVCAVLVGGFIHLGFTGGTVVFGIIGLLFLTLTAEFGAMVHVDQNGVRRTFLGKTQRFLTWDMIAETGVAGAKVLKRYGSKRTGDLYIYFSAVHMTEEDRFDMMLKWPPKDKIYMLYSVKGIKTVQTYWDSRIKLYNSGKLTLDDRVMIDQKEIDEAVTGGR